MLNEIILLAGRWIILLNESKPGSERQRLHVFYFHMWKINPKAKYIHKHGHSHYIYIICTNTGIVGFTEGTGGGGRGKEKEGD
jgi:hypothetical protein